MTVITFLQIAFILLIMMIGAYLLFRDIKNSKRKKISLSDDLHDKDGIPVVPRHLRKFSEKDSDSKATDDSDNSDDKNNDNKINSNDDSTNDGSSVRFKNLKDVAKQSKLESDSTKKFVNDATLSNNETLISNDHDNIHSYQQSLATEELASSENQSIDHSHSLLDIPPVSIKAENITVDESLETDFDDEIKRSLQKDMEMIANTTVDFSEELNDVSLTLNTAQLEQSELETTASLTQTTEADINHTQTDRVDLTPITHKLHYTSGLGHEGDSSIPTESQITTESVTAKVQTTLEGADAIINLDESENSNSNITTNNVTTQEEMPAGINPITVDDTKADIDSQAQLTEVSPVLDQHLQATSEQDQNSPLINASDNLNISIIPSNEFSYISGEKLLQMVDDFGFKFGTMNMFHRYQNKDGTGILWFSMMGLTRDGIVPFDLNTLPTIDDLKGLVMFLPLPHPKVMQGFDSMMSIAGLMAREIDGIIIDEYGDEVTVEYKKELRNLLQSTLVND